MACLPAENAFLNTSSAFYVHLPVHWNEEGIKIHCFPANENAIQIGTFPHWNTLILNRTFSGRPWYTYLHNCLASKHILQCTICKQNTSADNHSCQILTYNRSDRSTSTVVPLPMLDGFVHISGRTRTHIKTTAWEHYSHTNHSALIATWYYRPCLTSATLCRIGIER